MNGLPTGSAVVMSERALRLPGRTLLDTRDIDEAASVVGEFLHGSRVDVPERPDGQFRTRIRTTDVGDLMIAHMQYGTPFAVRSELLECYAVNLTVRGRSSLRNGARHVTAEAADAVVLSPAIPATLSWSDDTELLCLVVPRRALEEHFRKLTGRTGQNIVFGHHIRAGAARLLDASIETALDVSGGGSPAVPGPVSWQLRDTVLTALLLDVPHSHRSSVLTPRHTTTSRLCDAAITMMRRCVGDPPSIPSLAAQLGVGERSLQVGFREHYGTTPSAMFKQLRLEAVHEALLRSDPREHTVARLAAETGGFLHHGRFAAEYLQTYAEHPSETLARTASETGCRAGSGVPRG